MFVVPEHVEHRDELIDLIEENGGVVVRVPNPLSYQISCYDNPDDFNKNELSKQYHNGKIYSYTLIRKSVENQEWENPEDHLFGVLTSSKKQSKRRKHKVKPWTLTEIIKVFQTVDKNNPTDTIIIKSMKYDLPDRSEAAIRTFINQHYENGQEKTLKFYQKRLKSPYTTENFGIIRPVNTKQASVIKRHSTAHKNDDMIQRRSTL